MGLGDFFEDVAPYAGAAIGGFYGGPTGAMVGYGIGSGISGTSQSARAQKDANKTNINLTREQMDFQERMSNTAYQRGMEDMKKAGLNPMLAFQQGGASTPQGANTKIDPVDKKIAERGMAVSQLANSAYMAKQQATQTKANVTLSGAQAAKAVAEADKIRAETKGLGRKESEGQLWKKFYDGINEILDNTAKGYQDHKKRRQKIHEAFEKKFPKGDNPVKPFDFNGPNGIEMY